MPLLALSWLSSRPRRRQTKHPSPRPRSTRRRAASTSSLLESHFGLRLVPNASLHRLDKEITAILKGAVFDSEWDFSAEAFALIITPLETRRGDASRTKLRSTRYSAVGVAFAPRTQRTSAGRRATTSFVIEHALIVTRRQALLLRSANRELARHSIEVVVHPSPSPRGTCAPCATRRGKTSRTRARSLSATGLERAQRASAAAGNP